MTTRVGYVYCLSNPAYQSKYKVGCTKRDPYTRMQELYTTGVAEEFKLEFAKKVIDFKKQEKIVHKLICEKGDRPNKKREFFVLDLNEIKNIFDTIDGEYYENKNVDKNVDENLNENKNVNENLNENLNKNLNENKNVDENLNKNLNENKNVDENLNKNLNENKNVNENLNKNLNENKNVNENLNKNKNVNENLNKNKNVNENLNKNKNVNENVDDDIDDDVDDVDDDDDDDIDNNQSKSPRVSVNNNHIVCKKCKKIFKSKQALQCHNTKNVCNKGFTDEKDLINKKQELYKKKKFIEQQNKKFREELVKVKNEGINLQVEILVLKNIINGDADVLINDYNKYMMTEQKSKKIVKICKTY
jgi:hypothetical protein